MTNLLLFASHGFFEGMGRIIDLGATLSTYNESPSPAETDARALYSDWQTIGQDMRSVIETYAQEQEKA